jgi:hypothetical protein
MADLVQLYSCLSALLAAEPGAAAEVQLLVALPAAAGLQFWAPEEVVWEEGPPWAYGLCGSDGVLPPAVSGVYPAGLRPLFVDCLGVAPQPSSAHLLQLLQLAAQRGNAAQAWTCLAQV